MNNFFNYIDQPESWPGKTSKTYSNSKADDCGGDGVSVSRGKHKNGLKNKSSARKNFPDL